MHKDLNIVYSRHDPKPDDQGDHKIVNGATS